MTLKQIKFLSNEFAFISFKVRKNINMTPLIRLEDKKYFLIYSLKGQGV